MSEQDPTKYQNMVRRAIKYKIAEGDLADQGALAARYDVHPNTITRMNRGRWSPAQRLLIESLTDFCAALRSGEVTNGSNE